MKNKTLVVLAAMVGVALVVQSVGAWELKPMFSGNNQTASEGGLSSLLNMDAESIQAYVTALFQKAGSHGLEWAMGLLQALLGYAANYLPDWMIQPIQQLVTPQTWNI